MIRLATLHIVAVGAMVATSIMTGLGCSGLEPPDVKPYGEIDPATGYGDLSNYLEAYRQAYRLPAMAAAVVDTNGIVAIGVAGERRSGSEAEVTLEDQWHIGSSAKSMTATLVAILVEEGLISWETTLAHAFPDLERTMHPDWRAVTVEQLLTHRGGAPSNLIDRYPKLWERLVSQEGSPIEQRRALVEEVTRHPPEVQLGKQYEYSNAGYAIAGAMAEAVTETAWEDLMRTRLFSPLGMTSAGFGAPVDTTSLDQPRGHDKRGQPVEPGPDADNPPGIGPAGTVHLTVEDWAKYATFHLRGAGGKADMLDPETFERLHRPYGNANPLYAMGWEVSDEAGPDVHVLTHTGSNTIWYSMIWMPLEHRFGVLVVANQGGDRAREAVDQALWNLALDHYER